MVISQPPGNNPSYYYRAHQRCLNLPNASRDTLCSIQIQHQGNSEMVLLSIFFTRIRSTEDHQQIVLYSFCRSMRLLFIYAVKILLQIFLYEDLSTLALHTSVGCISLQNATQQDRTLLRNQYY